MKLLNEKQKSILVTALFLSAFFLFFAKFYIIPKNLQPKNTQHNIDINVAFKETVLPSDILFYLGNNQIAKDVKDSELYFQEIVSLLNESITVSNKPVFFEKQTFPFSQNKKGVELIFSPETNANFVSMSLFGKENYFVGLSTISKIYIPSVDNKSIYVQGKEGYLQFDTKDYNQFPFLDKIKTSDHKIYYTLNFLFKSKSYAVISNDTVKNLAIYQTETLLNPDMQEQIAKTLFAKKYDLLNKIVETDGKYIYTYNYGQQILRISPQGGIEYINENFSPENTAVTGQFHTAVDFMTKIGYTLSDVELHHYEPIRIHGIPGTKFVFKHIFIDLPIDSKNNFYNIEVSVVGEDVYKFYGYQYKFSDIFLNEPESVQTSFELLDSLYLTVKKQYPSLDNISFFDAIDEIKTVYWMNEDFSLTPCYRITWNQKNYYLNIYTKEVLYELE